MSGKINRILKGELISSIFYVALGLCLILIPTQTVNVICKIVFGILMIGVGVYHIYIYIVNFYVYIIIFIFTKNNHKKRADFSTRFSPIILFVQESFPDSRHKAHHCSPGI